MWREILGIFSAAVGVGVFNQVLKDGGVEIKLLMEDMLKTEAGEFVDDGFAELIPLVGDVLA